MASQITVRLSDALFAQLNQPGVFAYAVSFDASTAGPVFTNIIDVNSYGFAMSISNGLSGGTRGYSVSGGTIFTDIANASAPGTNVYNYNAGAGPLSGDQRMKAGPTDATAAGFAAPVPFSSG